MNHPLSQLSVRDARSASRPMRSAMTALLIVSLSGLSGCVIDGEGFAVGSSHHNVLDDNAMTSNAMTSNAMTSNAMTSNAMTSNALGDGVFELDYEGSGGLEKTALGRELLRYTARCAFGPEESLYLRAETSPEVLPEEWLPGLLNLAPLWKEQGITTEKAIMSACLLAHLNEYGTSVDISVRYDGALPPTEDETADFYLGDAVFYGDVYDDTADPRAWYSCKIPTRPGTTSGPTEDLRVCDDGNCGVIPMGDCTAVCGTIVADGDQWQFSNCLGGGRVWSDTFTVWLEGDQAPACDGTYPGYTCDPTVVE